MNIDDRCRCVAKVLVKHVPASWSAAWADVVVNDDHTRQTFDYADEQGTEHWFSVEDDDDVELIYRSLRDVRDFMAEQTGQTWKKVRFTVHRDGTFRTEFQYD